MISRNLRRGLSRVMPVLAVFGSQAATALKGADPSWWRQDDTVVITGDAADNKAVANIGQAKYMAKSALKALRKVVPQVADAVEADLVGAGKPIPAWTAPAAGSDLAKQQSAALLVGQLKAIAKPFYDHLHSYAPDWLDLKLQAAHTYTSGSYYPWTTSTADDANHGLATLGQLKAVFALDFASDLEERKSDGIPDLWEYAVIHADTTGTWTSPDQINNTNATGIVTTAGPVPNTLEMHIARQVDSRLPAVQITTAGRTSTDTFINYEDTIDGNSANFLQFHRNPDFWAADMVEDFTCVSSFNFQMGRFCAGTAVTPRHIVLAHHELIEEGKRLYFVDKDDHVYERTVAKTLLVPDPLFSDPADPRHGSGDVELAVLNADLPASIHPVKILPPDVGLYFSPRYAYVGGNPVQIGVSPGPGTPTVSFNQYKNVSPMEFIQYGQTSAWFATYPDPVLSPKRYPYYRNIQGGDSGHPTFVMIHNHLALMGTFFGPQSGPLLSGYISQLNQAIVDLDVLAGFTGPHPTVQTVDLSEFLKF